MLYAFLHGLVLAIGLILPLGPQNAFVLAQGAIQPSFPRSLPVVFAAGCCDTLLILLAVLGISVLVVEIPVARILLTVGGVLFLLVAGLLSWRGGGGGEADGPAPGEGLPPGRQVALAVAFSLGNPHAILDTVGVIGTGSLAYHGPEKAVFTGATILVSWLWFAGLALAGRALGRIRMARRLLARASAVVMWVSAAYLAATLL